MDNILAFPITLSSTTSSIELAPVNYSLSANTIAAGSNITANFAASNTGTTAAGAFNVGFYLSNSTTLDTTKAINLGVYTIASLNASTTTSSLNKTLTIPTVICSGTYYLFIFVDNGRVITETNENNNTSYQTINLTSSWTPTTPANPTSNSPQCGNVTITRNGAPVTGDTWYWQTSPTGTSQSLGSGTTYTAATSGTYYIRAYNTFGACWSSGSGSGSVTIITTPSAASIITGATTVCQGQNSVTYTIPTIDSATSYIWTLPTGAIGTSTTNSITVSYGNTAISGNITVKGHNSCGNGVSSSLAITVNQLPPTAGTISGTTTVCSGQSSLIYTVPVIANATSYVWTLPTGATGTSSTNSITVNYGNNAISGNISVYGTDSCGNGVPSSLAITLSSLPATAGTISGTTTVCQGQSSVTYTVPSIINATSYIWTLPTGVIGTSSTNSITVSYGNTAVSGNITVYGINSCGNGISSSLAISVSPLPVTAGTISGVTTVCQGQISLIDTVPGITNATSYIWTLPTGATGTNTTNNIIVNYSNTAISGNITVKGHNTCGDGTSSLKAITVNPLPATAGTISGTTSVYVGQSSLTYTVPAITNATSYVWTLPSGATGTSSTNSITVSYSNNAVSGNISVYGTNSCGNGSSSSLSITVSSSPVNLGTFSGADIAALYNNYSTAGDIQEFLFANTGGQLNLSNITSQYKSETSNFAYSIYDKLTCSGDFDGDGKDEVAIFVKMKYQPNCASGVSCPAYYRTHVVLLKSDGNYFHPIGSWYSDLDTVIDAAKIRFTTSGDFDNDGKSDIAFVYSNGSSASSLMVLKSTGNSFTAPTIFFNALTTSFKMDSVMFALSGDYDGDGKSDMALIYKNNTNKNISVFTSTGTVFNAAQSYYTFPDSLIMTQIKYALSGNFTSDSKSDIALLYKSDFHSSPDSGNVILVLKAMVNSFANPKTYINLTNTISNYSKVLFATTYDFNNDGLSDIALAFDTQTGNPDVQKILLIPSHDTLFATPVSYWNTTTSTFNFTNVKHFVAGKFSYTPAIKACNWQGNKIGALTFSFDDGYDSTIINSKYLYTKGVLGTHNIITHNVGTSNFTSWARMQADTLGNEYGSHTQTHPFLNNIPLTTAATELTGSKQELISHLSTDALSIVLPDGAFNNDVLQSSAMRNNYLSARTSMPGYNLSTPIDQYALYAPVILNATDTSTVFGWVNKTVNYGYWTFLMMHYIGADNGQYSNSFAKFKTIVDYACKQNLWINTQENVMKYITERNALKHVNYSIQNTNTIKLNLDDGLNDIVYNVPLTIKVFIPNTCMKDSVAVTQTGITKYYPVVNENGTLYSYVNCLPNTTDVLITNYRNNITSTRTICQGSSIIVGNHTYSTSGTYLDSLKTSSGCDSIITTILTVNTLPVTAGTITGTTTVNQGQSSLIYIVPAITNATSYVWTLPTGATGTSTTNSITVSYGNTTVSGNITIKGHNTCGDGVSSSLAIIVNVPQVSSFDSLLNIVNTYNQANYTVPSWTLFLKARTALANNKNNTNLANLISVISKMKSSSMPYNIVMNLNKDPKTKMAFDWFTNTGITGEQVQIVQGTASDSTTFNSPLITVNAYCGTANNLRYCLSGNNLSTLAGIADNSTRSYTFNKALVSGLTPNTQYSFRVGKNGAWSDIGSFKTAKDAKDAFSFVYTTDHQATQVDNDFNICQLTTHAAKTMFPQANFWLNCGDIADDAAEWEFEQFFETQQDIFMNNPMVIVQGNHADDSTYHQFTNHFNTDSVTFDYKYPTKAYCPGSTYSFVYGDALFMALNFSDYGVNNDYTHFKKYLDSTAVWMSNQVKAHPEVKWRIAFFHINMYTGAGHYNDFDIDTIQNRMGPVFDSLKIDLALQGHDHIYEVIGPINNRNLVQHPFITNPTSTSISSDNINGKIGGTFNTFEGTLYFLNRNAGNKGYDPATMPSSYSNLFTGRFGQPGLPTYSYVTVATDSINISTYKVNPQGVASLFDAFKIVKTSTISNCVAPLNQPTSLVLTPSATSISGSFTASTGTPSADHYLIIKSTSATLSANPVLGTTYTTGQTFGGGTIINYQTTTSFTDNGVLTSGTQYYYFIYAANSSSCTGGPIYLTTSPLINSTSLSIAVVPNGQWVVKTSGTTSDLMSVYFPTSNIGYAAGGSGTIVKTTNAGATWTSLTSLGKWLGGIFFTDSITGYAVGNDYSIIKTTNGSTWVTKYQNTTPPAGSTGTNVLYSVYFTDANTGYAVGLYGKILKTTDAGSTWTTLTSGTTIRLNSVCFANSTNGFVAGLSGIFLKTINSGTNWTPISIPTTYNLYSVNFINSTTGLAVGYDNTSASGLILRTTDGGTTWIRQTLSNTIKTLYSVYFTDVNTAYISGTSGVILMSTNGGTTWTTQTSNTTNTLLSIYFPNPYSGYSVGVGGKIVKYQVLPATAGTISGLTTVTTGQSGVVYTVPAIANATSYVWTLPSGTTGTSSTNSITVDYSSSAVSGYITVKGVNSNGNGTASSLAINVIVGKRFDLDSTLSINQIENTKTTKLRIFPNPSSEQTVFSFNIANPDNIKISLFNQQGKLISVIKEEYYQTGEHTFNYNTSILSSGIYFIKFETKKYQIHEKMIIIHK